MNNFEQTVYKNLDQDIAKRTLYDDYIKEDVEIESEYKHQNFSIPSYEEIAAKTVFNTVVDTINKHGEIIVNKQFGKLKNNKHFMIYQFNSNKNLQILLENESSENKLFPDIEFKYLEENKIIGILSI